MEKWRVKQSEVKGSKVKQNEITFTNYPQFSSSRYLILNN